MAKTRTVGEPLRIRANLTDGASNKYVRASLYGEDGTLLSPASVDLQNLGNGLYGDDTTLMPNQKQVLVRFQVFEDAQFSINSICPEYPQGSDVFELSNLDPSQLVPNAASIKAKVSGQAIGAVVKSGSIKGVIDETPTIKGKIEGQTVNAIIDDKEEIEGVLDD